MSSPPPFSFSSQPACLWAIEKSGNARTTPKRLGPISRHFSLDHCEFFETRTTTAGNGFATANSAEILPSYYTNAAYQQEKVEAIANLASATAHNYESFTTLIATAATLTTKLATTNAKLINALVETTNLTDTVGELRRTTPKPCGSGQHYCWSCGYVCAHISWE